MLEKKYQKFLDCLNGRLEQDRIYTDELRTFAWGTDASFYRKNPKIVIRSKSEDEVSLILAAASENGIPITFRAAGTALSGQSVTDSVLVVAGKNWEGIKVGPDAETVTLQPGLTGGRVNEMLARYGRKLGPDPASIGSAMIGGIVMNNASGMSCGVHSNSDRTMVSARLVFADGTVLDTSDKASRDNFRKTHPALLESISRLRDEVLADAGLTERIRYKYSIKNVTGLNLLPMVTYVDPFDIIAHSVVGSEGTLAFLSEVTVRTVPVEPFQSSAMIYFRDIREAARAVVAMRSLQINAAEMLDSRSLAAVGDPVFAAETASAAGNGNGTGLTAVLTQVTAPSMDKLADKVNAVIAVLKPFDTVTGVNFSTDKRQCDEYWAIRSGIFPMVGGMRRQGTTCLIEDVAFHIEDLPEATADLSSLLDRHGYEDSCIYGHALDGNFHFIINQAFDSDEDVSRYEALIRDVAAMVVEKYDGSLKAEHGTGRNMAPFVAYEWGDKAFMVMKRLKAIFDPAGILNPGVIFNDDPKCFISDFKALPVLCPADGADVHTVEAFGKLNKCIECGFCEVNCVSCGFTLSSRTRIAAMREIFRLRADGSDPERLKALEKQYVYAGMDTCAADGLCSVSCPMKINVADLTHELRRQNTGPVTRWGWTMAAEHYGSVKTSLRAVLGLAQTGRFLLGDKAMSRICLSLHKSISLPLWTPAFPAPYAFCRRKCNAAADSESGSLYPLVPRPKVVYFPSCLNQTMGSSKNKYYTRPLAEETIALLVKAGYDVIFPENMKNLCCGMIWESKGMADIADRKIAELEMALRKASNDGEYPVLCDQSPCLHRMRCHIRGLRLYEPAEFIWTFLRDRLIFTKLPKTVAVHVTCTTRQMGLADTIVKVAGLCAEKVVVPEGVGCCGFAGDKGMTHPELNRYALRKLHDQVRNIEVGYSNSRTCEIGLQHNSGIPYCSIVYLVNSCTSACIGS